MVGQLKSINLNLYVCAPRQKQKTKKFSIFSKNGCHAEFISASKIEILKRVQNDIIFIQTQK